MLACKCFVLFQRNINDSKGSEEETVWEDDKNAEMKGQVWLTEAKDNSLHKYSITQINYSQVLIISFNQIIYCNVNSKC